MCRENKENTNIVEPSYNCPICKDAGSVPIDGNRHGNGPWVLCKCTIDKINRERIKNSGLADVLARYTMEAYQAKETWQQTIKEMAEAYINRPDGWFFIGGQSGSGKSHICTAICNEFMNAGKSVRYMPWVEENTRLKSCRNNEEEYNSRINPWKKAEVLYIDDFFKTRQGAAVTGADVMTAYEILNYRYIQNGCITLISTELSCDDILDIDMAIGGRIIEKTRGNMIFLSGTDKNQRLKACNTEVV